MAEDQRHIKEQELRGLEHRQLSIYVARWESGGGGGDL